MTTHYECYGDRRLLQGCAFCGGPHGTRDHVPPRVLLDRPYPANLPVVQACGACNQSSSSDEQYLACLVECARSGHTGERSFERDRIGRTLAKSPGLGQRLREARSHESGTTVFSVEHERVTRVLSKMARGHALWELHESLPEPAQLVYQPLHLLSRSDRSSFETPPPSMVFPEVGSRALQRLFCDEHAGHTGWVVVQPERYRFLATPGPPGAVRIVISEYLAVEAVWAD